VTTLTSESFVLIGSVYFVLGVMLGEIFDVWYDLTHGEALVEPARIIETVQFAPDRPLAFGYAKLYFREVLATPDAFEHYHWGLWLATNAVTMFSFLPSSAFLMIGTGLSLILDENRRGLADKPFGVGKPYFLASSLVGVTLSLLLIVRILAVSTLFESAVSVFALVTPFLLLVWFWSAQRTRPVDTK